jgi:3'(2'), 5'-bisphosphate nucleotidase
VSTAPALDGRVLFDIAQAAGEAILQVYAHPFESALKDDGSPVTAADLRADAIIRAALTARYPQWPILSEESGGGHGGDVNTFFLVDPLDGTKEFLQRNGEFTVNIALVHHGRPVAGIVLAPALGEAFCGSVEQGAFKREGNGAWEPITTCAPQAPLRVLGSRSHGGPELARWIARLQGPHTFVAAGSSLKFCRLAEGEADVYPRMGPTSQWDTAAGQAVLEAAGGVVLDAAGEPLRYGLRRPVLNPHFIALGAPTLACPTLE